MVEPLYEGPAHGAVFYVPAAGVVRFRFSDSPGGGYVRAHDGVLMRVQSGARLFLSAGQHVLSLYDPSMVVRVSIKFWPN